jgi:predicted RNA-binding Zn-ribbon protein involved in translation (DUF1610 family)
MSSDKEYFCPNCGSTLNDQYGFDPGNGNWSCTSCGQELYDDDVYEGDIYPGIMWHCDQCGALLNKQDSFHDSCGSWTCTECGHSNSISEDTILEKSDSDDSDDADDFNSYDADDFDSYDNDNADNLVDTILNTIVDTIADTVAEREKQLKEEEEEENDDDEERIRLAKQQERREERKRRIEKHLEEKREQEAERIRLEKKQKRREDRKRRIKRIKAFFFNKKKIMIGAEPAELINNDINMVMSYLQNVGFTKIQCVPKNDIYVGSEKHVGEVEQIDIDGNPWFSKDSMIAYDAKIILTYHEKREIPFPFSLKQANKMNIQNFIGKLRHLGYTNIKTVALDDLVTGWIKKDGAVEQVFIDGETSCKQGKKDFYDTEIVVTYHTFKIK